MICQGQRCQSARHKHGDYWMMKAERCSGWAGSNQPGGSAGSPTQAHRWGGTAGKGWPESPHGEQRAETAAGGKRASRHPSASRPIPLEREDWRKGCTNHCSSRANFPAPPQGDGLRVSFAGGGEEQRELVRPGQHDAVSTHQLNLYRQARRGNLSLVSSTHTDRVTVSRAAVPR